ncbi:uncharacterized protein LOC118750640 [Rhagoletis pomonella]|uniref:uncharacterized protein LOC118750640 n=1 Tax=Rhagoletis pomonella TaxID=28610 RepID=UPI001782EE44|nr:uncharacterized protein LOC118750640 [Rhagoletis pomonella]
MSRKTESYFSVRLESLSSMRVEFRSNHRNLMRHASQEEVKSRYLDEDICSLFEEAFIQAVSIIREGRNITFPPTGASASTPSSNPDASSATVASNDVPLPEVKLPTFNGNYIEWPTFKEVFESRVHNNNRLTDLQRFHYLKGALSNDAAQDIEHLSIISDNYQVAWSMLVSTYDNKRVLFYHYMDVFDLQIVTSSEDASALKRYTQTCRSCVNSIKKLGVNIDEQNHIFVYYMLKKLPSSVRNEWERTQRAHKNIPLFTDLCNFLDEYYQVLVTFKPSALSKQQDTRKKVDPASSTSKKEAKDTTTVPPIVVAGGIVELVENDIIRLYMQIALRHLCMLQLQLKQ